MKFQYKYYIISTIIGLVMIGLSFQHMVVQEPAISQIEKNLKQEYDLIPALPDASLIKTNIIHKSDRAIVSGYFTTKLNFKEVREYYDKQLVNKGWNFYRENKKINSGSSNKFELRLLYYRKGDYVAVIEYDDKSNKEDNLAFSVSWGVEY